VTHENPRRSPSAGNGSGSPRSTAASSAPAAPMGHSAVPPDRVAPSGPPGAFVPEQPLDGTEPGPGTGTALAPGAPRRRRSADVFSVTSLLAYLPYLVMSVALVLQLGSLPGVFLGNGTLQTAGGWAVFAGWSACGVLLVRSASVEGFFARLLEGSRLPTESERARLEAVWSHVTAAAGVDGSVYQLWVQDIDELNASATSGHIVTVTSGALQSMSPRQLAAVLAHELGHHLGGHAWMGALTYWYCLPARLVVRVLSALAHLFTLLIGAVAAFAAMRTPLGLVGLLVFRPVVWGAKFMMFILYAPVIVLVIVPVVVARASDRFAELRADRLAVDVGYGPTLVEVFQGWAQEDAGGRPGVRERLLASHPPLHRRITKAEKRMRDGQP
jgi:Zn-dependent protease with chaperone function